MSIFKRFGVLIVSTLIAFSCIGCGSESSSTSKVKVVCTIFPEYEWTLEIMGDLADDAEVTYLLKLCINASCRLR